MLVDHSSDPVKFGSKSVFDVRYSIFRRKSPLEREKENQLADFAEGCTEVDARTFARFYHFLMLQPAPQTLAPFYPPLDPRPSGETLF
jgi:hypothetical protein